MKHASVDRAKRVDPGCKNHGSCPYCRRSRTFGSIKLRDLWKEAFREWKRGVGLPLKFED